MDVAGPFVRSLGGYFYRFLYLDHASDVIHFWLGKQKSQQPHFLEMYRKKLSKQFDRDLKTEMSDRGGEYTSNKHLAEVDELGIEQQFSGKSAPAQNSKAERKNRTIDEVSLLKCTWPALQRSSGESV